MAHLNMVCHALGVKTEEYSMHSFRIGGATELFRRGVRREIIKILGRWHGLTYEVYIRPTATECSQQLRKALRGHVLPGRENAIFSFTNPEQQ